MQIAKLLVVSTSLLFLASGNVGAQTSLDEEVNEPAFSRAKGYFDVFKYYSKLPGLFTSYNKCRARGFSADLCHSALSYCAINEIPLGGLAGSFISAFQLNQLFRVDCGDGTCYQCCFVPGRGCHSSFVGFPVINCNANYGPGTRNAGRTMVVDPNAQPGQACLSTPQTCDHIGTCSSVRTPQQIEAINQSPQHIIRSPKAVTWRARTFAEGVLNDWSGFLSSYHTSSDTPSDSIRQQTYPLDAIHNFVTGRGCAGWRHMLPDSYPTDWSEEQFRLNNSSGAYAEEPSHFNGIRQLGMVRLLASVPNLFNRLSFAESKVWTPAAVSQHLAALDVDPDQALLESMSPVGLAILKKNLQLQDYRLLAVPLLNETPAPRLYNGCPLADPPALHLAYQKRGVLGVDLQIEASDSTTTSNLEVGVLVLWGDGGVTRLTAPPGGQLTTASHDYATGGKYQILAVVENEAGLRTIGAVVAETLGIGANPANSPTVVLSEFQLVDLKAQLDSNSGNPFFMMFEIEGWPTAGQGYALGISRALEVPLGSFKPFGTVAGWNLHTLPLQAISIRPSRFGDGYLFGFRGVYFTVDRLRVGVYSTEDNQLRYWNVPVTPEMVRLYPAGSSVSVPLSQPTYSSDGRLRIPVQVGTTKYARIDLVLPQQVFTQAVQGPVTDDNWLGFNGTWTEMKPN